MNNYKYKIIYYKIVLISRSKLKERRLRMDNTIIVENTLEEKEINDIELAFYIITGKVISAKSFIKIKNIKGENKNDIMEC